MAADRWSLSPRLALSHKRQKEQINTFALFVPFCSDLLPAAAAAELGREFQRCGLDDFAQ